MSVPDWQCLCMRQCVKIWLGGRLFFPFTMVFRLSSLPTGASLIFVSPRTLVWLAAESRAWILSSTPCLTSLLWNFTVIVAVKFWATALQHQRFLVSCDNEAAVTVINLGSTKDPFMQRCLRQLWFTSALHDVDLRVQQIPGEHKTLADALSRWDNTSSQTQFAQATTALGISYIFGEIPGDFCYFDVDWYFFALVIVFLVCFLISIIQTFIVSFFRDLYHCIFIRCLCSAFSSFCFRPIDS